MSKPILFKVMMKNGKSVSGVFDKKHMRYGYTRKQTYMMTAMPMLKQFAAEGTAKDTEWVVYEMTDHKDQLVVYFNDSNNSDKWTLDWNHK